MAYEITDILVDNDVVVSGSLTVSGLLILGAGGTDIASAIGIVSGNLISSGQTLLANDALLNTAITTLSGNLFTSGQALQLSDTLLRAADATLSGNIFSSGQLLLVGEQLLNTADQTLSGNLFTSGQTLLVGEQLLNTAIGTLSGNLFTSGQALQLSDTLLRAADATLSGNLFTSGQVLLVGEQLLNTASQTLSGLTTGFSSGSVLFAGPTGNIATDKNNLFFDYSNNRLGVGLASGSPYATIHTGSRSIGHTEVGANIGSPHFSTGEYSNYLLWSQAFSITPWINQNISVSGSVSDPQGNLNATQISGTATNGQLVQQISDTTSGVPWNFSIWMKAASTPSIQLQINSNVTSGTASSITLTPHWQRYSVTETFTNPNSTKKATLILPTNGEVIQVWGAQFDQNAFMRPYATTRDAAITAVSNDFRVRDNLTVSSGSLTLATPLSIANGGTGQVLSGLAFNNLAPTNTSGDLIVYGNGTNGRLPVGASGTILIADPIQPLGMNWKTLDLDAQTAQATAATTTTSASFVDLAGATLTTVGRSNTKQYMITFAGVFSSSANNTTMSLQFVINGSANANSVRTIRVGSTAAANFAGPMMSAIVTVPPGQVIKVQWDTSGGTLTLQAGTLTIFGIA